MGFFVRNQKFNERVNFSNRDETHRDPKNVIGNNLSHESLWTSDPSFVVIATHQECVYVSAWVWIRYPRRCGWQMLLHWTTTPRSIFTWEHLTKYIHVLNSHCDWLKHQILPRLCFGDTIARWLTPQLQLTLRGFYLSLEADSSPGR